MKSLLKNFLFLLLPVSLFAQNPDIPSNKQIEYPTQYASIHTIRRGLNWSYEDTSMNQNQVFSPVFRNYLAFQDLGFIGSPSENKIFDLNRQSGFNLCANPYQPYFKTAAQTQYINTKRPYADFNYAQGPNALLYLDGKFSLNLNPRFNVGADFSRITQEGFYLRQYSSEYFTRLHANYQSKNKRFIQLYSFNWNRGVHDENGGITSDSLFETLTGTNKSVPVYLSNSQSRFKHQEFEISSIVNLGPKQYTTGDDGDSSYVIRPLAYFIHQINWEKQGYFFDNVGDSAFFLPAWNLVQSNTYSDSVNLNKWTNRFAFGTWRNKENASWFAEAGISLQNLKILLTDQSRSEYNLIADGELERNPKSKTDYGFRGKAQLTLLGYNAGDFNLQGKASLLAFGWQLEGGISNFLYKPDQVLLQFRSNPYLWSNDFNKINVSQLEAILRTKAYRHNFEVKFQSWLLTNWVYIDSDRLPKQNSSAIPVTSLQASKTFQAGFFLIDARLALQNSGSDKLRLPAFSGMTRWYVKGQLFKKALHFSLGVELRYFSEYYANAWNPATRQFYLQNNRQIGNYPLIDVFVSGEVKKAILFAKLEHANMDLFSLNGYYFTPSHPLPIRALRLGLRWRMYN